jgi:hypothetical protein
VAAVSGVLADWLVVFSSRRSNRVTAKVASASVANSLSNLKNLTAAAWPDRRFVISSSSSTSWFGLSDTVSDSGQRDTYVERVFSVAAELLEPPESTGECGSHEAEPKSPPARSPCTSVLPATG